MTPTPSRKAPGGGHTTSLVAHGIAAIAVTLVLVAGVPVLLVALLGNPIPGTWSWDAPLTNDAILGVIAVLAWVFWAQMTLCLVVESVAEMRIAAGRSAEWMSTVPGTFGAQQALARTLVQAAIAIGIGSTAVTAPTTPWVEPANAAVSPDLPQTEPATAHLPRRPQSTETANEAPTQPASATPKTVTVAIGDSLWSIAERHLGSGERWREISALNQGRTMTDGQSFREAGSLQPGWTLLVPQAPRTDGAPASVTVDTGDTLWSLADQAYGEGTNWPRILEANRDRIEDPDLIYPGQRLIVPQQHGLRPDQVGRRRQPRASIHPRDATEGQGRSNHTENPPPASSTTSPRPDRESELPAHGRREAENPRSDQPPVARGDGHASNTATPDKKGALLQVLAGGGALLAAGLLAALATRRRSQFRARRSARTIASTPPELVGVEGAIRSRGSAGGASARFLDHALRDLAARAQADGIALPEVVAARLGTDSLELIAAHQTDQAPDPWQRSADGLRWSLSRDTEVKPVGALAPYPTLVAIGLDHRNSTWLVDLEAAGLVQLLGDPASCTDLARFMAAELATNKWSDDVDVILSGIATELIPLNPSRLETADALDLHRLTKTARRAREATQVTGHDVLAGRADGRGADTWLPTILLADGHAHGPDELDTAVNEFLDELSQQEGRSTVALIATGLEPQPGGLRLTLDPYGRILTPWLPELTANRLSHAESHALADLFTKADHDAADAPMPPSPGTSPPDQLTDAAGAIRAELTQPRTSDEEPDSLLPEPNQTYLTQTSTTEEDLDALAPHIPAPIREQVEAADSNLDADIAEWRSTELSRPRLRLLGPVELQVTGERSYDVSRRYAYYTEMVAYLLLRPQGVLPQQMAEAFNVQPATMHTRIGTLRGWLGTDESTGNPYLPESTLSRAGRDRGLPVYQLSGVLCDADLFKRLRVRGQGRGPQGIIDLISALGLVTGAPFDQPRRNGYGWLAETPHDHYLTAGIVDVAHIIATQALTRHDPGLALWAAERAISASPTDDKPRLDLAKAKAATGRVDEAAAYLKDEVLNRSDDDDPPPAPTARTERILARQFPPQ